MDRDGTMTPTEAAEYLHLHLDTVRRLLRQGTLPGRKVGKQWRIRKADLDVYLGSNGHQGNGKAGDREDLSADGVMPDGNGRAWLEVGAEDAARRLAEVEADIPPSELKAYLEEIANRGKPVRWNPSRGEFEEVDV